MWLKKAVYTQCLCYGYNFCTLLLTSCVWTSFNSLIFITELSVIQIFSLLFKNIGRLHIWVRRRPGKVIFLTILLETWYCMIIIHRLCFNNLLQDLEDICPLYATLRLYCLIIKLWTVCKSQNQYEWNSRNSISTPAKRKERPFWKNRSKTSRSRDVF